jgi:hypothetical protein
VHATRQSTPSKKWHQRTWHTIEFSNNRPRECIHRFSFRFISSQQRDSILPSSRPLCKFRFSRKLLHECERSGFRRRAQAAVIRAILSGDLPLWTASMFSRPPRRLRKHYRPRASSSKSAGCALRYTPARRP